MAFECTFCNNVFDGEKSKHKCLAMQPQYQYKRTTDWEEVEKLGSEGWELATTASNVNISTSSHEYGSSTGFVSGETEIIYYLKREITE